MIFHRTIQNVEDFNGIVVPTCDAVALGHLGLPMPEKQRELLNGPQRFVAEGGYFGHVVTGKETVVQLDEKSFSVVPADTGLLSGRIALARACAITPVDRKAPLNSTQAEPQLLLAVATGAPDLGIQSTDIANEPILYLGVPIEELTFCQKLPTGELDVPPGVTDALEPRQLLKVADIPQRIA